MNDSIDDDTLAQLVNTFEDLAFINYPSLERIAIKFRILLETKKRIILFAHNGTGKTRLSGEFHTLGKEKDIETRRTLTEDTLYYNAFTEDLFSWDNDLEGNAERALKFNRNSTFFGRFNNQEEMENRIRPLLNRYADFNFKIDYDESKIRFFRDNEDDSIKISRGEENIFIWCFFLAIVELALAGGDNYDWVKYIYIDDPISSLDDNNVIAVASHLAQILKSNSNIKTIISTHHTLFFNILHNEFSKAEKFYLSKKDSEYHLKNTGDTPFFHHVASLQELKKVADTGTLYPYHFNTLRSIMEKTASFHGFTNFMDIIKLTDDEDGRIHERALQLFSHGGYSLFEPVEMVEDNKIIFRTILINFMNKYPFNQDLFTETGVQ